MLFCNQSKSYSLICCGTIPCFSQQNTDILYNVVSAFSFSIHRYSIFNAAASEMLHCAFWEVPGKCNDDFICLASQTIMTQTILASKTAGIHTHPGWVYTATSLLM